jgi:hypothetical protein
VSGFRGEAHQEHADRGHALDVVQAAWTRYDFCRPDAVVPEQGNLESCRGDLLRNRVVYHAFGGQGKDSMDGGHP